MRIQITNTPQQFSGKDTTIPEVSSSLKPIDRNESNLEAEKDEIALSPDLMNAYKILGKPHSQGGTPLNLESGSFIFSKDKSLFIPKDEQELFNLKLGGSTKKDDNTPAKILLRNVNIKHHNQMSAILDNPKDRDVTAKNTAQVMIKKNQEKFGQIAFLQESKKNEEIPEFSKNTQPIYSDDVKQQIVTEKQYMKEGGMTKMQWGGFGYRPPTDKNPRKRAWNDYSSPKNPLPILPNLNPDGTVNLALNPPTDYNEALNFDFSNYVLNGDNLTTREGNGFTDAKRAENFRRAVSALSFANPNNSNLSASLNPANIKAWQSGVYSNYKPAVDYFYNNGYIARNNASSTNNATTFQDGYYRKDRVLPFNINTLNSSEKDNFISQKGLIQIPGSNLYAFGDKNKGTAIFSFNEATAPNQQSVPITNSSTPVTPSNTNTLSPNPVDGLKGVYTDQKVPFNTGQISSLVGMGLINGMRKNYFPQRAETSFTPLELEKLNPNAALQDNTNSWLQAARLSSVVGGTPAQSSAMLQNAAIQGTSNAAKIRNQYEEQNVQIANQQNQYNNQGFNAVRNQNVQLNNKYNDQVNTTLGRANEEKINAATDLLNTGLQYYGENKQMENALNSMQQFPQYTWNGTKFIPKVDAQGRQVYNTPYSYTGNGFKFNDVSGWNMINGDKQDTFNAMIQDLQQQIQNTTDERAKAYMQGNLVKLLTSKQTPYINKYGGIIKRK